MKTLTHTKLAREADRLAMEFRNAAKRIRKNRAFINKVAKIMNASLLKLRGAGVSVYQWETPAASPSLACSINGIDSFKNEVLMDLMAQLMDLGFVFHSADYPSNVNRDFYGDATTSEGMNVKVQLAVYVKDDSPTCKKVAKSSRMVEQVEYEIVCD